MKTNIYLVIGFLSLIAFTGKSQVKQGAFMVGGSTYFNYNIPNGGGSTSVFNVSPTAGVFIVDNMAIGASVSSTISFNNNTSGSSLSIAPFLRAYYNQNFYGQLQVGYGRTASNSIVTSGLTGELDMGYTIFLTSNVAIDPALYYNFYMNGNKYGGSNLGFKLGFQIFLNR